MIFLAPDFLILFLAFGINFFAIPMHLKILLSHFQSFVKTHPDSLISVLDDWENHKNKKHQ